MIQAAGHYKKKKKVAIIEPMINIIISVIIVVKFGLIGIAVGALAAILFRTIQYSVYMSKHIVKRSQFITFYRCIISICEALIIIVLINILKLPFANNYFEWVINAIIVVLVSGTIVLIGDFIFFRKDMIILLNKIKNLRPGKQKS